MTDKPVFDRAALEDIMSTAKAARVRHLGNAWRQSPKGFRWSGLGVSWRRPWQLLEPTLSRALMLVIATALISTTSSLNADLGD
jgi:hypothetical protein